MKITKPRSATSFVIPDDVLNWIRAEAERECCSLNKHLIYILQKHMAAERQP